MPIKSPFQPASSFNLIPRVSSFTSSQQCLRSTYRIQQTRSLKYNTYIERKQQALSWIIGEGNRFKRPAEDKVTNYLGASEKSTSAFDLKKSAAGQEGGDELQDDVADPWDDREAVARLTRDHSISNDDINGYISKYAGITPATLHYVLTERLEGDDVVRAIQDEKTKSAASTFDPEETARRAAVEAVKQQQRGGQTNGPEEGEFAFPKTPFPLNKRFQSEAVLSEELREMIYLRVKRDGLTVRSVSTLMGVSMERVGAVVRMKQMERDWVKQGKPLAVPYSKAVLSMIPTTPFVDTTKDITASQPEHEPLNEIPVHPATTQQIFLSVPESRHFTREDAGRGFHPELKSADVRIPHPELLELEKFKRETSPGVYELRDFTNRLLEDEKSAITAKLEAQAEREAKDTKTYKGRRWDFKFQDVSVDSVGMDGRSRSGVGWRYGMPHEDRKRGYVKIPTSVS